MSILRIPDDNRGNVGRASTAYSPVAQTSTNAWVLVVGSTIDATNDTLLSMTIHNTGAQTISWKVLAGNTSALTEAIEIKASADIVITAWDSYSNTSLVWRYYGIYIIDKVGGQHGEATIFAISKA